MQNTKIFVSLLGVVMLFTLGCAALFKNYGRLVPNSEVTQALESYQADHNLNYYFSGSSSRPNAIMGLDKAYTLDSDLWQKIGSKPGVLKNMVTGMQSRASSFSGLLQGSAILANNGRQIGIWYSLLETNAVIKMEAEHTVIIHTPPLDTFSRHESDDDREN